MKETLLRKIADRSIVAGVIGLGYVGIPLDVEKAKAGFRTIGFDVQPHKVDAVNAGHNYIGDVVGSDLQALVSGGRLSATNDFSFISEVDFVAICVPTPLDAHQQPDISYVENSARAVSRYLHKGIIVVLESTTYPGTTSELLKPILEESGLKCGEDFYLGFSPERVDPGNALFKTKNTPKVVGGIGDDATEVIAAMYEAVLDGEVFRASSPEVAEMTKILENTYRNINIGLVNELAMLCHKMKLPLWEVIDAASTKPFGFHPFYPGPGLGGHCIPLDPYYLSWKAREWGFHTSMIEASMMVNDRMPEWCADRAAAILSRRGKALLGAKIIVLGVAYKNNVDDYRESPALKVIDSLSSRGASVSYYDPYIPSYKYKGIEHHGLEALKDEDLSGCDLVLIAAAHSKIDYERVVRLAPAIFDTRNATRSITDKSKIELL